MLRIIIPIAAMLVLSNPAFAQEPRPSDPMIMKADAIGPVKSSFGLADLLALGWPVDREDTNIFGDPVTEYTVRTPSGDAIKMIVDEKEKAFSLETRSLRFVTPEGARVGMTLGELKRIYPQGDAQWVSGEFFYFAIPPYQKDHPVAYFDFDPGGLRNESDIDRRRSVSFSSKW